MYLKALPNPRAVSRLLFRHVFSIILFTIVFGSSAQAQVLGEYRSATSGKWSSAGIWQRFDGTNWAPAPGYPGSSGNIPKVTISAGHIINLTVDIVANNIDSVLVYGTLKVLPTGQPIHLNMNHMEIYPDSTSVTPLKVGGSVTWDATGASFRIPYNSTIGYPPTYQGFQSLNSVNSPCSGNNILYLGGGAFGLPEVQYASCRGNLENVCLNFDDMNEVGGIVRSTPFLPPPPFGGTAYLSCSLNPQTTLTIKGVPKTSLIKISLFGRSGSDSVTSIPATIDNLTDGGPNDLDGIVNGSIVAALNVVATSYGLYPLEIKIDKTYGPGSDISCQNFVLTSRDTVNVNFLPPPSLDIVAPTSVCGSQQSSIKLTNNSPSYHVGVYYTKDGVYQQPIVVNPNSTYTLPVSASSGNSVKYIFKELLYVPPSPVAQCPNVIDQEYVITVGTPSTLAIDKDSSKQPFTFSGNLTSAQGCRIIAGLLSPFITEVDSRAFVANAPIIVGGSPIVARRVWMEASAGNSSGSDRVTIYALPQEFVAFNGAISNNKFLPITPNDPEGYASNLRIYRFEKGEYDSLTGLPYSNLAGTHVISSNLISLKWNLTNGYWEMTFPSDQLGLFVIGNEDNFILPLKLLDFKAKLGNKTSAVLNWTTAEERNVKGFDVEVSADGVNYRTAGFVAARNSTLKQDYEYNTAMPGKLGYFRLKLMDTDGKYSYSPVRMLKTDNKIGKVYPNPAQSFITVDLTGYPAGTARLIDMNGRTLLNTRTVSGLNTIPVTTLNSGIYMLELTVGREKEVMKVSVLRK